MVGRSGRDVERRQAHTSKIEVPAQLQQSRWFLPPQFLSCQSHIRHPGAYGLHDNRGIAVLYLDWRRIGDLEFLRLQRVTPLRSVLHTFRRGVGHGFLCHPAKAKNEKYRPCGWSTVCHAGPSCILRDDALILLYSSPLLPHSRSALHRSDSPPGLRSPLRRREGDAYAPPLGSGCRRA